MKESVRICFINPALIMPGIPVRVIEYEWLMPLMVRQTHHLTLICTWIMLFINIRFFSSLTYGIDMLTGHEAAFANFNFSHFNTHLG